MLPLDSDLCNKDNTMAMLAVDINGTCTQALSACLNLDMTHFQTYPRDGRPSPRRLFDSDKPSLAFGPQQSNKRQVENEQHGKQG